MSFKLVMFTAPNQFEARRIARTLLANRLAVSVSVVKSFTLTGSSDLIDEVEEYLIIARTVDDKLKGILRLVHEIHSSDAPDIILLEIVGGAKRYLERARKILTEPVEEEEIPEISIEGGQ